LYNKLKYWSLVLIKYANSHARELYNITLREDAILACCRVSAVDTRDAAPSLLLSGAATAAMHEDLLSV